MRTATSTALTLPRPSSYSRSCVYSSKPDGRQHFSVSLAENCGKEVNVTSLNPRGVIKLSGAILNDSCRVSLQAEGGRYLHINFIISYQHRWIMFYFIRKIFLKILVASTWMHLMIMFLGYRLAKMRWRQIHCDERLSRWPPESSCARFSPILLRPPTLHEPKSEGVSDSRVNTEVYHRAAQFIW